jgi:hypothetical protein
MSDEAIKPNFYTDFTSQVDKMVEEDPLTEDQQALAYITHFKGWELLEAYKIRLEEYLDGLVSEAMSKGLSMEEIGQRTMVRELTKYVLNNFVSKANGARKQEDTR